VVAVEHLYEHPTNVLRILSLVLQKLEDDLSERFKRPVLVDLRLFKTYELVYEALESNSMNFGRVGPSSYSRLLDRGKGIKLLAMQDHKYPLTMAIFTLTNSTFARILAVRSNTPSAELFTNVSIALGASNSTTGSYLVRWFLVTNGIFATNFSRYAHVGNLRRCIDQVRSGQFDFGVGNRDVVDDYPELTIIAKLEVSDLGRCWVGGNGLDNAIFQALRDSLLQMHEPAILGNLESEVVGFKQLTEETLERLRVIMRGAAAFDPHAKYE
jgi:ABC-type phosphate/phosphonate transport system substrate-binding protein